MLVYVLPVNGKCTYQFIVNEVDPESCPGLLQAPPSATTTTATTQRSTTTATTTTLTPDGDVFYEPKNVPRNFAEAFLNASKSKNMHAFRSERPYKQTNPKFLESGITELTGIVKGLEVEMKQLSKDFMLKLTRLELELSQEKVKNRELQNTVTEHGKILENYFASVNTSLEEYTQEQDELTVAVNKNSAEVKVLHGLLGKMDDILKQHKNLIR